MKTTTDFIFRMHSKPKLKNTYLINVPLDSVFPLMISESCHTC